MTIWHHDLQKMVAFYRKIVTSAVIFVFLIGAVFWSAPYVNFYFLNRGKPNPSFGPTLLSVDNTNDPLDPRLKYKSLAQISVSPYFWVNKFQLDKGSDDGIVIGDLVSDRFGHLLGIIESTTESSSIAKTVTNAEIATTVWVGNPENRGLLSGYLGYSAKVDWLISSTYGEDQVVYTSSMADNGVEGLYVGRVQEIKLGKSGSFYSATVKDLGNVWEIDGPVLVW